MQRALRVLYPENRQAVLEFHSRQAYYRAARSNHPILIAAL
jgi:hypothetical protein